MEKTISLKWMGRFKAQINRNPYVFPIFVWQKLQQFLAASSVRVAQLDPAAMVHIMLRKFSGIWYTTGVWGTRCLSIKLGKGANVDLFSYFHSWDMDRYIFKQPYPRIVDLPQPPTVFHDSKELQRWKKCTPEVCLKIGSYEWCR